MFNFVRFSNHHRRMHFLSSVISSSRLVAPWAGRPWPAEARLGNRWKIKKIKKINRFSSPAKKFRGFSRNPGAFWKQIHEWPAGPELPDRARPLRNSRPGLAGSEMTPRSPNSAEAENSLKFRNFGSSKKCPRCKLSRSLIPMRPKL